MVSRRPPLTLPAALIILCATPWTIAAGAAVPAADVILKAARPAQPAPQALRLTLEEVRSGGRPPTTAMAVRYDGEAALEIDVQDLGAGTTNTLTYAAGAGGGPGPAPLTDAPTWVLWLLGRPLDAVLEAKSIDTALTSLGHRGSTILWVLGAGPRDVASPQLHFERGTGRLLRTVEVRGAGDTRSAAAVGLHFDDEASPWPTAVVITEGAIVTRLRVHQALAGAAAGPPAAAAEPAAAADAVPPAEQ